MKIVVVCIPWEKPCSKENSKFVVKTLERRTCTHTHAHTHTHVRMHALTPTNKRRNPALDYRWPEAANHNQTKRTLTYFFQFFYTHSINFFHFSFIYLLFFCFLSFVLCIFSFNFDEKFVVVHINKFNKSGRFLCWLLCASVCVCVCVRMHFIFSEICRLQKFSIYLFKTKTFFLPNPFVSIGD